MCYTIKVWKSGQKCVRDEEFCKIGITNTKLLESLHKCAKSCNIPKKYVLSLKVCKRMLKGKKVCCRKLWSIVLNGEKVRYKFKNVQKSCESISR